MIGAQVMLLLVSALVVTGLEMWRRALRGRAPRWVNVVAILLSIEIIVGLAMASYWNYQSFQLEDITPSADRTTMMVRDLSSAMNANGVAGAGVVLSAIVLAIGSALARRESRLPSATLR